MLGVLESNLQSVPAYFNYFPNYSVSLGDGLAKEFLALSIKVPSDKFVQGTSLTSTVTYRLCYKVSNSVLGVGALRQSGFFYCFKFLKNYLHFNIIFKNILF